VRLAGKKDRPLAKGQIWKTPLADFEIMAMNQDFVYYKVTKQLGIRRVAAQVSVTDAMENYLRSHRARLVKGSRNN
jgi:hypothetical protein